MKIPTPQFLEQRKAIILSDLKMKIEAEDWHGVADAAMDLREIEAQLPLATTIGYSDEATMVPRMPQWLMDQAKELLQKSKPCEHVWHYSVITGVEFCQFCHAKREPTTGEVTTVP